MKILVIVLAFLSVMDLLLTPVILSNIRKTGGFHYLISTLHKFLVLAFLTSITVLFFRNADITSSLAFLALSFVLVVMLAFCFVKTFEIDDYFLRQFQPDKYDTSNMTEEGKNMLKNVFEEMKSQNERSFGERFSSMMSNFFTNIFQDIDVIYMVVTNNRITKDAYTELHKALGNDTKFASMSNKDLIFLVKTRIILDSLAIASAILLYAV